MRRSFFFNSVMVIAATILSIRGVRAQSVTPPGSPVVNGQKPPASLTPAIPAGTEAPADPAKMAQPAPGKTPGMSLDPSFVLGAQDQITVTMWDDARFSGNHTIRPDGMISIQLLGEIKAAGLTPLQLEDAINKAALSQLTNPHCTVGVVGVHSKKIYFDGEGIADGEVDLVMPTHLLEAISARGGFKEFANRNKIRILRGGKPYLVGDGKKKSEYIKYSDMLSGKHPEANPILIDGDHIIVN